MIKPFTLTQETTTTFEKKAVGAEAVKYLGATTTNPVDAFDGQYYTKTSVTRGIYLYTNQAWVRQTNPTSEMISAASYDIMNAVNLGLGSITDYTASGANFQLALVQNLFVGSINIIVTAGTNIVCTVPYPSQTVTEQVDQTLIFTDGKSGAEYTEVQFPASGTVKVNAAIELTGGTAIFTVRKNGVDYSSSSTAISTTLSPIVSISADDQISGALRVSTGASAYVNSCSISIAENPGILKYLTRPQ